MRFPESSVHTEFDSPLGRIILAASGKALTGLWFDGQSHQPDSTQWACAPSHPLLQQAQTQLHEYFVGQRQSFDLPLDLGCGTDFQQRVWRALVKIPFGVTCSYAALSADIGQPKAMRAVGAAIGRNPFSIIVPCHRVLGKNGALTGYAGGLARKTALLQLEGAV